ncbi:hypothetical protein Pcinc_019995 [Petrolisthes cinctipes]|uniref:Uncharacterized protein n=1 Tax=Petrolisthes cinctipes TaxID=88211 RepID=A0AAE1FK63_PETCI|nr:hypothetical protein Pcinc_019995 [Petrolisthes cinctipes]
MDDGFVVLTKDDHDADLLFHGAAKNDLLNNDFNTIMPPEIRAKKTVLLFNVDDYVYKNNEEQIKEEIRGLNSWARDEIKEVYKFPNSNTLKITFGQTLLQTKH